MNTTDSGDGEKPFPGPISLGNPKEFIIYQLAEKVIIITRSSCKMVFKPLPADNPLQRQRDIKLAKKHLDWAPNIDLDEGLAKTIAYFDDLLSERI